MDDIEDIKERTAVLENRVDTHELRLNGHDVALSKLNEAITVVRETLAKVATKDDIIALTRTINEQHREELRDAHNSVPSRIMMVVSIGTLILGIVGFALAHFHG